MMQLVTAMRKTKLPHAIRLLRIGNLCQIAPESSMLPETIA
jgi:hypothetical protein